MLKALSLALALFGFQAPPVDMSPAPWSPLYQSVACCKICTKGKACGDSCIKATYQCHKGKGCACNG